MGLWRLRGDSMTILPIDEINALEEKLKPHFEDDGKGRIKSRQDCEDIIDELEDLFLLAYANGVESVNVEQVVENNSEIIQTLDVFVHLVAQLIGKLVVLND